MTSLDAGEISYLVSQHQTNNRIPGRDRGIFVAFYFLASIQSLPRQRMMKFKVYTKLKFID